MDTPEFRAQLAKLQEAMSELDGICHKYAEREAGHIFAQRELDAMKDELNRRVAANEDQGTLPADIAVKGAFVGALAALSAAEAAKYPPQVAVVDAELAALNALAPGLNVNVNIPDLEKYLAFELIVLETTPPTIPPGVG